MSQSDNTIIIILAAGKGTRMNSNIPKVLHKINKKSMLNIVIETSKKLNPEKIIVVVGYKKELIINTVNDSSITFVNQNKQLGTGHAIKQCLDEIKNFNGDILILSGDVPLIKYSTLNNFILKHKKKKSYASLITTSIKNPKGYGRIIKNESGQLINIVEHKDANKDELKINEINSGIYIINSKVLTKNIPLIKNDNAQKEYYLPNIFNFIHTENTYIYKIDDFVEISGVNTIEQLKNIENSYMK